MGPGFGATAAYSIFLLKEAEMQEPAPFRVGQGFDAHAFTEGRPLIIGGVHIAHEYGLAGHSDADVLTHAVTDALLGAAGLGDLGKHFPDHDPAFEGADSLELLGRVRRLLEKAGWAVVNIDATIVAQAPQMSHHIPRMAEALARAVNVAPVQVNVKATTTEGLGWTGRGEGIGAQAVVLIGRLR